MCIVKCVYCGWSGRRSRIMQQVFFVLCSMLLRERRSTLNLLPFIAHFYIIPSFYCARKFRFCLLTIISIEFFMGFQFLYFLKGKKTSPIFDDNCWFLNSIKKYSKHIENVSKLIFQFIKLHMLLRSKWDWKNNKIL